MTKKIMCNLLRQGALCEHYVYFSKMEMCYAMRINCLAQKELTYSTLTSPQKTQANKTQYVEAWTPK